MADDYEVFRSIVLRRRSVRKFTDEPVSMDQILKICDTAHYAMSGGNSQPWEFLIVTDPGKIRALRQAYAEGDFYYTYWLEQQRSEMYRHPEFNFPEEELAEHAERITQELNAPALICLLYDPRKQFGSVLAARADLNDGDRSVLSSSMAHLSMLVQLTAASMGLQSATCYSNQQAGYRAVLSYPEPITLYSIACIGHGAYQPGPPKRMPLDSMMHYETYDMNRFSSGQDILAHIRNVHSRHGSLEQEAQK
jgi:nitroreductase